jgi:hypothetical protein
MKSAATIVLEPRESRAFGVALVVLLTVGVALMWRSALPPIWQALVALTFGLVALNAWRAHRRQARVRIGLRSDGHAQWREARAGNESVGELRAYAHIGPLIALTLRRTDGGSDSIALWRDMVTADAWRELVVLIAGVRARAADSHIV